MNARTTCARGPLSSGDTRALDLRFFTISFSFIEKYWFFLKGGVKFNILA